jgi:hypothetical protein
VAEKGAIDWLSCFARANAGELATSARPTNIDTAAFFILRSFAQVFARFLIVFRYGLQRDNYWTELLKLTRVAQMIGRIIAAWRKEVFSNSMIPSDPESAHLVFARS